MKVPSAPLVAEPSKPSPTTMIGTPLMGPLVPTIRFSSRPLTCSPSAATGWASIHIAATENLMATTHLVVRRGCPLGSGHMDLHPSAATARCRNARRCGSIADSRGRLWIVLVALNPMLRIGT